VHLYIYRIIHILQFIFLLLLLLLLIVIVIVIVIIIIIFIHLFIYFCLFLLLLILYFFYYDYHHAIYIYPRTSLDSTQHVNPPVASGYEAQAASYAQLGLRVVVKVSGYATHRVQLQDPTEWWPWLRAKYAPFVNKGGQRSGKYQKYGILDLGLQK